MRKPKYYIKVSRKTIFWYYRIMQSNGRVLSTSETYFSKSNALRGAKKLGKALGMEVR